MNFSPLERASRFCRFCKKVFCCTECRDRHVNKLHPGLNANCPLCASEILPMQQYDYDKLSLENEKLLSHIVDKHLPLHCILCGELFETVENFKSHDICKWYSERSIYRYVTCERLSLPVTPALQELRTKLKQCRMNDSNYSGAFFTPPEIYRKTSTPMFAGENSGFECQTLRISDVSLKTPKTSLSRDNAISEICESPDSDCDTKFFSFSHTFTNEEMTPLKANNDEQFPSNYDSKPDVKEKADAENKEVTWSPSDHVTSVVDMDLTDTEGGLLQESPKLDATEKESDKTSSSTKKVRFSSQSEDQAEIVLNIMEKEEFHNNHDINANDTKDTGRKDTKLMDSIKDIEGDQTKNQNQPSINFVKKSLNNSESKIFQNDAENGKKENRNTETLTDFSSTSEQGTSRVLMMVLVENSSNKFNTDLMPLINSGLKKLEEQIASTSTSTTEYSGAAKSTDSTRRSITKMEMSVSNVENYKAVTTSVDCRQIVPSSSFSSASKHNDKDSGNGGILSAVAQAVRCAFGSLSGMTTSNIERVTQRQEIVKESITSTVSSASDLSFDLDNNSKIRPSKRARDNANVSSWLDSVVLPWDARSPLAKRQRGWYKIKGRPPISRMRNNNNQVTSPRRVSSETQVFRQGNLTAGDTVIPLPTRAQITRTEE